jgi:hypothetical protein
MEIENAIDTFISYNNERRSELIESARLFIKRENINQRSIYVITNQFDQILQQKESSTPIFVAGPIGGGSNTLDHDLTESIPDKWSYLIKFDENNVAHSIESIESKIEGVPNTNLILFDDINQKYGIQNLPFEIDENILSIKRAYSFYEKLYQQASTLNDFSPLVDSGIVAAEAILNANLIYFQDFPLVLRQRMDLYGLIKSHHPNFLTIQKIKNEALKDKKIQILGYSFTSDGKTFSLINRTFFKGLKLFILAENELNSVNIVFNQLSNNSDLIRIIEDFERQKQPFGSKTPVNQFEARKSETLREIIGLDHVQKMVDRTESNRIEIPIGFIELRRDGLKLNYETNLDELELPDEYLPAIENLIQPLDVLATGPIKLFKYDIDEISVNLEIGKYRFRISKSHKTMIDNAKLIIYYNFESSNDFDFMKNYTSNHIFDNIIKYENQEQNRKFEYVLEDLKTTTDIRKCELTADQINLIFHEKRPVTLYAKKILSEYVVEMLLKRILNEVTSWEDGINVYGSIKQIMQDLRKRDQEMGSKLDYSEYPQYKLKSDFGLTASIEVSKSQTKKDSEAQNLLRLLNKEMDEFNPGFFNFILNFLRRESSSSMDNTSIVYITALNIFHDVKVAIVDFGLRPSDWVYAENLQLWNTYRAQKRYIEHALILKLSEILGVQYDGEELFQLTTYQHIDNMVFTSFNGVIEGHEYIKLKKAYLYITPKLEKYREDLLRTSSLLELLGSIENLENLSREKVRATLPQLPKIKQQRR